jgi:hypothetical protein
VTEAPTEFPVMLMRKEYSSRLTELDVNNGRPSLPYRSLGIIRLD